MSANKAGAAKPAPSFLLAFLFALLLAGCATRGPAVPSDPFSVLESGAAAYAVIPTDSHRPLLALLAGKQKDGEALERAFDRTDMVYASFTPGGTLRILASGDFPRSASALYFPSSKGWTRMRTSEHGTWYRSVTMDAAVPESGTVLLSSAGGMEAFLGGLKTPVPQAFPPSFASYAAHAEADGRIGVFIADARFLAAAVLGPDVSLPVQYAELYAQAAADSASPYLLSARIVMQDARTARAMSTLLRVAAGIPVRLDAETVFVDPFPVSPEKLVEWTGKLYFY